MSREKKEEKKNVLENQDINRRDLVKAAGATMVGVGAFAGTASAHRIQFYGCSQVCVDTAGDFAVIDTGSGLRCEEITQTSNRNDPPVRGWNQVLCLEVSGGEAIVGVCEGGSNGTFDPNPNRCAQNKQQPSSGCGC